MGTFGSPELREVLIRIPAGTTIDGAVVALCPAADDCEGWAMGHQQEDAIAENEIRHG